MAKKFLVKLICSALILSTAAVMIFSCATEEGSGNVTTTAAVGGWGIPDSDGDEYYEGEYVRRYQFPEGADFGGQAMRIITQDRSDWAWSSMMAEELTGDPINDAIYNRNAAVEQGLNVVITEFHISDAPGTARRAILAGSDDYEVVFTDSSQSGTLASQGMFLNLHYVPGLELDAPWWNQNAHESAELLGKLYFTTSDANLVTNDAIWVVYFNQQIRQDLQLDCPYEHVRNGTWTMEVFYNMARASAIDLDGDGVWTAADQWGISTHNLGFLAFFIGQGERLTRLDDNGEPYLIQPDERFVSAFYNAHRLMDQTGGLFLHAQGNFPGRTADIGHARLTFMANMSLFATEVLSHARVFREMEADFGLLPHPKYDVHQENYYTFMIDTVPAFGIPVTVRDPETVGIFMEAMTGVSAETIIPAYYEISLHTRFTRDEDSVEMLDIIREGRIFDLAVLYNWGSFYGTFISHGVSNPNPMTIYERHGARVATMIERTLESFLALEH